MATDTDTIPSVANAKPSHVEYPDSDGKPMADNTLQWDAIAYVVGALRGWFMDRLDVFVAGDLLWYYEEGNPKARIAPDGLIAIGRPPGYRGSYIQWVEGGICPQVVFEVLSPKNTAGEMQRKYALYARLGCMEYYLIDPYLKKISGFERTERGLIFLADAVGRRSPALGLELRFDDEIFRFADQQGNELPTMVEAIGAASRSAAAAAEVTVRLVAAEAEAKRADVERLIAQEEAARATIRAETLAARLRALGINADD